MKDLIQMVLVVALIPIIYHFVFRGIAERKLASNPGEWEWNRFQSRLGWVFAVIFFAGLFLIDFIFSHL